MALAISAERKVYVEVVQKYVGKYKEKVGFDHDGGLRKA